MDEVADEVEQVNIAAFEDRVSRTSVVITYL